MEYDYSKLIGRIVEKFGSRSSFASEMGMSERTISLKLNNKIPWKQPEMEKAAHLLDFPLGDIQVYFFALKVQNA